MRWLSRDPIGYEGGDNLYEYVDSNPVKFVDPDGFQGVPIAIGGGVAGAVSGATIAGAVSGAAIATGVVAGGVAVTGGLYCAMVGWDGCKATYEGMCNAQEDPKPDLHPGVQKLRKLCGKIYSDATEACYFSADRVSCIKRVQKEYQRCLKEAKDRAPYVK